MAGERSRSVISPPRRPAANARRATSSTAARSGAPGPSSTTWASSVPSGPTTVTRHHRWTPSITKMTGDDARSHRPTRAPAGQRSEWRGECLGAPMISWCGARQSSTTLQRNQRSSHDDP
jgi:hypothetical protein